MPRDAGFDQNAEELGHRDFDARHLVPAEIGADEDRNKSMLASDVALEPATVALANFDQGGEPIQSRGNVAHLLGHDHEMIVLLTIGQHDAKAIKDLAAHGREKP